tara:strand:+ start:4446 stop:5885 length:1440 start_codon:yes stop_codon:yes gene_type:complete
MARIYTFESYDVIVGSRREQLDAKIDNSIDSQFASKNLIKGLKKKVKTYLDSKLNSDIEDPALSKLSPETRRQTYTLMGSVKCLSETEDEVEVIAKVRVFKTTMQENLTDLYNLGSCLRRDDALNIQNKEQLYQRYIKEVNWFLDHEYTPHRAREILPNLNAISRKTTLSQYTINKDTLQKSLYELCSYGYVGKKFADSFIDLLDHEVVIVPIIERNRVVPNEPEKPQVLEKVVVEKFEFPEQERIDFLMQVFNFNNEVAQEYANVLTLQELCDLDDKLNLATGDVGFGRGLVELNPDIITYLGRSLLTKYISGIKKIGEKIANCDYRERVVLQDEFSVYSNLREYSTIEGVSELNRKLFLQSSQYNVPKNHITVSDLENLTIDNYELLSEDQLISDRLNRLANNGKIRISENEYWNSDGGLRGKRLLVKMSNELGDLFRDLKLTLKPRIDINQRTIAVNEDGRNVLSIVNQYVKENRE